MKSSFEMCIIFVFGITTTLRSQSLSTIQSDWTPISHTSQKNFFPNYNFGLSRDSSDLDFFPLAIGNVYEWRDMFLGWLHKWVILDTVRFDGELYYKLSGSVPRTFKEKRYIRIDSLGRVLCYGNSCLYYDSLYQWENIGNNVSFYRLFQKPGDAWTHCITGLGILDWPPYLAKLERKSQNEMEFMSGQNRGSDTIFGFQYVLSRGIGVIYEEYETDGYVLTGARINGVVYGQLVLDVDNPNALPQTPTLGQNYPNPVSGSSLGNSKTEIPYSLPHGTNVRLSVFDALGREIAVLIDGWREAGNYSVAFNANKHSPGIYYYRLAIGRIIITKKMILMR